MKRHTVVSSFLNTTLVTLVCIAWVQAVGDRVTILDIASLLGVIAFSLMWVHYAVEVVAPKPDNHISVQYIASRIAVLVAIIVHPTLINIYLIVNGYGLPPESYEKLVGSALPILLGGTALAAFVSFELRGKLIRFKRPIFHANVLAMFLILMHGFLIGMVIMSGWYVWVWWLLLVSFTVIALITYDRYYGNNKQRFYITALFVMVLAVSTAGIGFNTSLEQSATPANDTSQQGDVSGVTITQAQLKENDGRDGARCWIAIDGAVYDTKGNPNWVNGEHVPSGGRAKCGVDLSEVIALAPHGREVLGKITNVGTLAD